jgi:peptidoglycan/LPS O-acetylase OafA/YrhL/lysophospholipase L1-like esterase
VTEKREPYPATVDEIPDPDAPRRAPSLSYIPALDGIRALAIIVIMGYHGGVFLTSGGFYSLDTFFALSGFLITSLLISEWQKTTTIGLRRFWARRARRLLPALLVMLLGVAVYAAFLVPAGTYPTLRGDAFSALFYYANWHFIAIGSNYFDQAALTSPLTHTWSLAVEEQFYLVWPLVVLGVLKLLKSRWALLVVCVVGALASAIEMAVLYSPNDVNRLYYGTDTRAQSLLVGGALAVGLSLWADHRRANGFAPIAGGRSERRLGGDPAWAASTDVGRQLVLVVGLLGATGSAVLWTVVSSNDAAAYQGGFFLAALATTAVLFSVVCWQGSVLAQVLSLAPLRYVGRISYGMYLWHFPLFLFLDSARTGLTGFPLFALRVAVTLAVATCSFYLVERPIRQGSLLRDWKKFVLTPAAVFGTAVVLVVATNVPVVTAPPPPATSAPKGPPFVKALVVGDSTAETLTIGLSEHASNYGVESFDGGILGCGITSGAEVQEKGVDYPMDPRCSGSPTTTQWPTLWREDLAKDHPNVVMILAGRWEVSNRTYKGHWTNIENPTYAAYVQHQLRYAVQLAGAGGAAVVVLTAPCYDTGEQPNGQPWPEDSRARLAIYNGIVRDVVASTPGTSLLNFNAMACPGGHYEEYLDGQQVRLADGIHFTFTGGNVFASRIWPFVVKLGRRQMNERGGSGS